MRIVKELTFAFKKVVSPNSLLKWLLSCVATPYVKYLLCGGFNTTLCFIIYCSGIMLGFNYQLANSMAWVVGVVVSFILSARYVFNSAYQYKEFLLFVGANVLSLIVNMLMLSFLINSFHVGPILASIMTIPCVILFNFVTAKAVIFKPNF